MKQISENHPELEHVYPGVRQMHDGMLYREGRLAHGEAVIVPYYDGQRYRLSEGTFSQNTLHVVVTESDGFEHYAGEGC